MLLEPGEGTHGLHETTIIAAMLSGIAGALVADATERPQSAHRMPAPWLTKRRSHQCGKSPKSCVPHYP
jgi:hypothetical protein